MILIVTIVILLLLVLYFIINRKNTKFADAQEVGEKYKTYWQGKNVFVTGATAGIGKELARVLCNVVGMNVYFGARTDQKARQLIEEIKPSKGQMIPVIMDQENLTQVAEAMQKLKNEPKVVERGFDLVVMNAGMVSNDKILLEDQLEKTYVVNHLSHFLMNKFLLPELQKVHKNKPEARLVVVSSRSHQIVDLDLDDLNWAKRPYKPMKSYGASKAYNILFTKHLTSLLSEEKKKYENEKSGGGFVPVTVNSLFPGIVRTEISRQSPLAEFIIKWLPGSQSVEEGTRVPVWVSLSDELKGKSGGYYGDFQEKQPSPQSSDPKLAARLWEISEEQIKKYLPQ